MNRGTITVLTAAMLTLLLTACMNHPPPPRHPGPYKDPVDAFDATNAPYDPSAPTGAGQPLSDDIAHLRDARAAYEHSQTVQAARLRDQQEKCRKQPNAKLVRIHDGTGDPGAVYCQTPPAGAGSGSDGKSH
ncbi:hypothetical protein ACS8Y6_11395 [Salinisphaera sp. RV14]|uniref:hypothetical protein n=1 Tax=Salinisphaera sp. RV14 TaxID=3454140 RepID=UPI003F83E8BB